MYSKSENDKFGLLVVGTCSLRYRMIRAKRVSNCYMQEKKTDRLSVLSVRMFG